MVNEEIVGTDVDRNWYLNSEGDLKLVKGSDNLSQAIFLRLTAYIDSLKWAYNNYGSKTKDWLGKNQNIYTHSTLVDEIQKTVEKDPRINEAKVEIINWTSTSIGIKIKAIVPGIGTFQEYYIFSDLPRLNENINSPVYKTTHIDTKLDYYAKQDELITVHCYVRDRENKKVPVGEVTLTIGNYAPTVINQNPQTIAESGTQDPGGCTFTFRVPRFIKIGTHELNFTYKGIRGYNNCIGTCNLHVVDRLLTNMEYIYPKDNRKYYVANDYDFLTEPVVHVTDVNEYDVTGGEVRYYVSDYTEDDELITIDFPIIFHNNVLLQKTVYMTVKSKLLNYSTKFMFNVNAMFRPGDIFDLYSRNGELIDTLECEYRDTLTTNDTGTVIFYLTSTTKSKPYHGDVNEHSDMLERDINQDIDTQRKSNSHIIMEVIE